VSLASAGAALLTNAGGWPARHACGALSRRTPVAPDTTSGSLDVGPQPSTARASQSGTARRVFLFFHALCETHANYFERRRGNCNSMTEQQRCSISPNLPLSLFWSIQMFIKDLSVELSAEAQAAVHGGGDLNQSNTALQSLSGPTQVGPVASIVGAQANTSAMLATIDQANTGLNNDIYEDNDFSAVLGSLGVAVFQ
jgi:hypothetical protein